MSDLSAVGTQCDSLDIRLKLQEHQERELRRLLARLHERLTGVEQAIAAASQAAAAQVQDLSADDVAMPEVFDSLYQAATARVQDFPAPDGTMSEVFGSLSQAVASKV